MTRLAAGLAVGALLVHSVATARLHGDIRYVLACLRSGEAVGISPSETFTHRPYFYRWFIHGLDQLTAGPTAVREAALRAAGVLLCLAAGLALRAALRRRLPHREADLAGAAVALALALAPRTDFLQPEWTAALLSVLAVAAVLAVARPLPAAALAAVPLGLAVMMKYSTAATALIALLVVLAADRVRALLLAAATAVSGALLLGFSLWSGSREWQWIRDMPRINQGSLSRRGLRPGELFSRSADFLADRAVLSPVLLLLPAALLLLLACQDDRRRRARWALLAAATAAVGLGAVVVQGNWFAYHAAALPVGAAAVWGLAVARWYGVRGRAPVWFLVASTTAAVLAPLYSSAPGSLQRPAVVWSAGLVALGAALADLRTTRDAASALRLPPAAAGLAGIALAAVTVWPASPHLMDHGKVGDTNAAYLRASQAKADAAADLRRRLPDGALVQYLAFGDEAYFIGHASPCPYPVPTFLQRTRYLPDVAALDSYAENARCLEEDPPRYAVLNRGWFPPTKIDRALARRIEARYDCPPAPVTRLVVCRLR
ncbi:hypothetical protein [Streptomyces sp. Tu 3180]|uniref:hypothetical protein n=1 Tax=Streptomyces sp. Tu 3180 TaxID=2682611 RepID=UPI00135A4AB1|nr:hypothetical protein [Streptomyces sp. Tu 3180]KAF3468000.1 hypothetical protein GL259_29320 [Streptomyces sp. Tu 3180]